MAKYKVLQKWKNEETHAIYEAGQEIELTVERAEKAIKNLKKYDGKFLERIDNKEEDPPNDEGGEIEGEGK